MKQVKYVGDAELLLPTLNVVVNKDAVIDVPDDFNNALFEDVKKVVKQDVKEVKPEAAKEVTN